MTNTEKIKIHKRLTQILALCLIFVFVSCQSEQDIIDGVEKLNATCPYTLHIDSDGVVVNKVAYENHSIVFYADMDEEKVKRNIGEFSYQLVRALETSQKFTKDMIHECLSPDKEELYFKNITDNLASNLELTYKVILTGTISKQTIELSMSWIDYKYMYVAK